MKTLEEISSMDRDELLNISKNELDKLNLRGLVRVCYLTLDGLSECEKYNIHTSTERLNEILEQEKEEQSKIDVELQPKKEESVEDRDTIIDNKIAELKGNEKRFIDRIEKGRKICPTRYDFGVDDFGLLYDLYGNDSFRIGGKLFFFGFYQGMQYLKNQNKKKRK